MHFVVPGELVSALSDLQSPSSALLSAFAAVLSGQTAVECMPNSFPQDSSPEIAHRGF